MRKLHWLTTSITCLTLSTILISSCKDDDDEPPVKAKLSFAEATRTVNEADGTFEIEVVLDKPAEEDLTIEYSLSGTAVEKTTVNADESFDYEILSDIEEINIDKGETTGIIEIQLYSDGSLEEDETIEFSIEDVSTDNIDITRDDETTITITQEDGLIIGLAWPATTTDSTADMDLLVRGGPTLESLDEIFTGSIEQTPEIVFIPTAIDYAVLGLSYVYYDGNMDPLPFKVTFIDFVNGEVEAESGFQVFEEEYTSANKNKWTNPNSTIVVQTVVKSNGSFSSISDITIPTSGSRIGYTKPSKSTLERGKIQAQPSPAKLQGLIKF